MQRALIGLLIAAALTLATPAAADPAPAGTATVTPTTPGTGVHLMLDAQGAAGGGFHRREIPTGLMISLQRGFAFDPSAVAGVCADADAGKGQCPANSIIGTGSLDVFAEGLAFGPRGQHFSARLDFFRANPRQPGDPMGVVFSFLEPTTGFHGATIGRLETIADPVFGPRLRWDALPIPKLPSVLHFTLERLRIDLGAGPATPPVRVHPTKKRKPRCRKVTRRTRGGARRTVYVCPKKKAKKPSKKSAKRSTAQAAQAGGRALLTSPGSCSGSWQVRLEWNYPSGAEQRDAGAPCTGAR